MFAQIDVPAYDYMDSDTDPTLTVFEWDDKDMQGKGLKIVVGETVVILYPLQDFIEKAMELV